MVLVLGLGNPGKRYENTRHNAGFLVADRLAGRWSTTFDGKQFSALLGKTRIHDRPVILAKPQTFMNRSGHTAASLRGYYKVPDEQVVVVHDDVDIPFGQVRVKRGGGHGGHNGLRDLKRFLGTGEFPRVRFGVSRPPPQWDTADYVLSKWAPEEAERLQELVDRAADAVEVVIRDGVTAAMNTFNERPRNESSEPPDGAGGGARAEDG
jgi:PTH1 family peptidyl-tRNA hydrolase